MSARTASISPAMEDYLKAIHQIAEESGGAPVQTQALSDRLEVSTASVTGMMKKLDQYHLVEHEPYRGVVLTPKGEAVALEVLRHHRLLELYLVEQLVRAARAPEVVKRLTAEGFLIRTGSPEDLRRFQASEIETLRSAVRKVGIKPE
mgnify:CR=1 FL=1